MATFLSARLSCPVRWCLSPQAEHNPHPHLQIWLCWQEREASSVSCFT